MEPTFLQRSEVNKPILVALLLLCSFYAFAQRKTSWEELSHVEWSVRYLEAIEDSIMYPTFSPSIRGLEGQEIQISGYLIPVDVEQQFYVLSSGPFASCFFCGVGGPESIVELQLADKSAVYSVDDLLTFKGRLKLNWVEMMHFNYILENAIEVK